MSTSFKSHPTPPLSIFEKLAIGIKIANALRATTQKFITTSVYNSSDLPPKGVQVQSTLVRSVSSALSAAQIQFVMAPSSDTYKSWVAAPAQTGYEYAVEDLSGDGVETRILWVGEPWKKGDAKKKVVFYFHGGGFICALSDGHLGISKFLREDLCEKLGDDVAVGVVEYSLGRPGCTYPTPMKQCALALNHLLSAGCSPSSISLAGDSAGGHLVLSIVSHILHPHPEIEPIVPLSSPLGSAVIISPWVSFNVNTKSFEKFETTDVLSTAFITYWAEEAFGKGVPEKENAAGRHHVEALSAPESWWNGLGQAVKIVGIIAGSHETFLDSIVEFGNKINVNGAQSAKIYTFVADREIHDNPLFDFQAGRPPGNSSKKIAEYIAEGFRQ